MQSCSRSPDRSLADASATARQYAAGRARLDSHQEVSRAYQIKHHRSFPRVSGQKAAELIQVAIHNGFQIDANAQLHFRAIHRAFQWLGVVHHHARLLIFLMPHAAIDKKRGVRLQHTLQLLVRLGEHQQFR